MSVALECYVSHSAAERLLANWQTGKSPPLDSFLRPNMAAPQPVQDAKHVNSLMNTQTDISYRFAGEGLDYQKDGVDRSPETMARVDKLLRDGWASGR